VPIIPLEIPASRAGEADLSLKPAGLKPAASILWISNIDDLLIPGRVVSNQLCHGLALIAADAVGGLLVLLRSHGIIPLKPEPRYIAGILLTALVTVAFLVPAVIYSNRL
jgi:hypothetical protein